ncbi:MAG: putative transport system permease protein [Frankiales bacterium]|nr:putative transport system permease protein [Frankiales bacterium]
MFTTTIRGMLAHKLRVVLTTVSIALGVAFVAGTLILTDTTRSAFDQLFGRVSSGTDAVVRHEAAYSTTSGVGLSRSPIPAHTLDAVRQVDGVGAAEGVVSGYALITDTQGKAVLASGGAPTMGYTMQTDAKLRGSVHLLTGHAPAGAHEVAVDATSAASHHIPLGSTVRILFRGPAEKFTVVGTVGFGGEKDFGGTTSAYFEPATAQRVLGAPGVFDEIQVRSDGSISDATLANRLNAVVPQGLEAVTGAALAKESSDAIESQFAFLGVLFMSFAGIALFVGSFIIWNTFTMIVSQRTREIALTRAIGASRRQVIGTLLAEAGLLGITSSAIGVGCGVLVAKGLNALMAALGFFRLPSATTQVQPRTIWVSMIVGTLVTVLAAVVPARRATKVLPIEALRDATPGAKAPSKLRAVAGGVFTSAGIAGVMGGLYGGAGTTPVLLGMVATLVGVLTLAPLGVRPLAAAIGAPIRVRGVAGDLARQNAMRNPRRTASTASALMIGLVLVVGMGVFASSLKASFGTILHDSTNADLYVTAAGTQGGTFSPDVENLVRSVPGVAAVSATGYGEARFGGSSAAYSSVDPTTVERALNLKLSSGSASALGTDGVLVKGDTARSRGWRVGQQVPVEFAATGTHTFTVRGLFDGTGYLDGDYIISLAAEETNVPDRLESGVLVMLDNGAAQGQVKAAIAAKLSDHPDAKVLDRKEYARAIGGLVDQLLTFVSVMLLLSVLIALLGIVNTLALSVHERTRELGLLRAVGMTTAQVRAMVRWESVIISLIGAVVGAGLGLGLGATLAQTLKGEGITEVAIPGVRIGIYVVAAAVAGVLAAVGPGRAAARVDLLKAVVTD